LSLSKQSTESLRVKHDEIEAIAVELNRQGKLNEELAIRIEAELAVLRLAIERKEHNASN
jgi:hypothetical protein